MQRFLFLIFFLTQVLLGADDTSIYYGEASPQEYLSGRFEPSRHSQFVDLATLDIATDGRRHYLRKEAAHALKEMFGAFHDEHPDIRIYVCSSTRNFDYQKRIWDAKYNGSRLVGGKKLNVAFPDKRERVQKILEYSSMPGTSRHHWGTDFDINSLRNSYYEKGEGKVIYQWLVANAKKFGFVQVYTEGRDGGYNEEKWHWSYVRVSRFYLEEWRKYFSKTTVSFSQNAFGGSDYADDFALYYVTQVNEECK